MQGVGERFCCGLLSPLSCSLHNLQYNLNPQMYNDYENYKFDLSVSTSNFTDKNTYDWQRIKYAEQTLSIQDFCNLVKQSYCFCNIFEHNTFHNAKWLYNTEKSTANFKHANVIIVDVDNTTIDYNKVFNVSAFRPTILYTTPNNQSSKSNGLYRYRLVYIFDKPITDTDYFSFLYDCIVSELKRQIQDFVITDNCGRIVTQQFAGSYNNCTLLCSNVIYSLSDFPVYHAQEIENSNKVQKVKAKITVTVTDNEFIEDVKTLSYFKILNKYKNRYNYYDHTELDFNNGGYALVPDNYLSIYRKWYKASFIKTNGDVKTFCAVQKTKDQEGRRKKLFLCALIMRKIKPDVSFENLLFNLVYEVEHYYSNADGQLSPDIIINIAQTVISKDISEIVINTDNKRKPKFIVDKSYCYLNDIKPNVHKQTIKKQLSCEEIGSVYDCSISPSENLTLLKELGFKVCLRRIYDFCNNCGIEVIKNNKIDRDKILSIYDHNLSIKDNCNNINGLGFKVSLITLKRIINELGLNKKVSHFAFKNNIEKKKKSNIVLNAKTDTPEKTEEELINDVEILSHLELCKAISDMEFERHISEMQTKYNNIKPNNMEKIKTEIIPIEEEEVYTDEDIEISKNIIRSYHANLLSLKTSDLSYNRIMALCNDYMYYINKNCECLPKQEAEQTIKACNAIVSNIKAKFDKPIEPIKYYRRNNEETTRLLFEEIVKQQNINGYAVLDSNICREIMYKH
ncbi:hypothetical protein EZS27_013379 [termite gut metagenome]|uniref:Uncharacterized protein n=1 Tax=termite gut metagenome TaxID=433724 RepID=A0A5J4RXF7_9ZZZZ